MIVKSSSSGSCNSDSNSSHQHWHNGGGIMMVIVVVVKVVEGSSSCSNKHNNSSSRGGINDIDVEVLTRILPTWSWSTSSDVKGDGVRSKGILIALVPVVTGLVVIILK